MRATKGPRSSRQRMRGQRLLTPAGQARLGLSSKDREAILGDGARRPAKGTRGMSYESSRSIRSRR